MVRLFAGTLASWFALRSEPAERPIGARSARPLRRLAVEGTFWTVVGHGSRQVLRLAGNLVLTRLLFPEAFGLMALVQVVTRGLEMFSDVGVNASVIRDRRGDEPSFLNTAWTIRALRGVALWVCATLLAWPAARLYGEPQLVWMIPVAGLTSVFLGFSSLATLTLQRHVRLRPLVIRDIVAGALGLLVTIGLAIRLESVWALVWGGVISAAIGSALTYVMLPGRRPHFRWDPSAAREMYRFGRWIFVSTALTFLLQQGDKAILGALVEPQMLGIYAIAVLLSRAVLELLLQVNSRVLFPLYARLVNERPEQLRSKLYQARLTLLTTFVPPLWALVVFGRQLVALLYDPRYADAGWMLQILAAGTLGAVISATTGGVLLAVGDSFRFMVLQVCRAALLVACMAAGATVAGLPGLIVGVALSKLFDYPVLAWAVRRHGVWMPRLDGMAFAASAAIIGVGLWLTR